VSTVPCVYGHAIEYFPRLISVKPRANEPKQEEEEEKDNTMTRLQKWLMPWMYHTMYP
jgi:hypothetical protein